MGDLGRLIVGVLALAAGFFSETAVASQLSQAPITERANGVRPEFYAFTRASSAFGPGSADFSVGSELVLPTLTVPQGSSLQFVNLSIAGHSIYSEKWIVEDELRLFNSEPTPFRRQSEVRGVPDLKPGTYQFFCGNHMGMRGELTIIPSKTRSITK